MPLHSFAVESQSARQVRVALFTPAALVGLFLTLNLSTGLANEPTAGDNRMDEPVAESFELRRAVAFLDSASLEWHKGRKCFTCHTNYAYLYARPLVSAEQDDPDFDQAHRTIRGQLESLVSERWERAGPRWDAEVVASAAALAFNDAHSTQELHATTRVALDRMWTVQRKDGGFDWLKCDWPPLESDDHYGATLALIAVGVAPEDYAATPQARTGIAGIRRYLKENPPTMLHHQAMLLWASAYHPTLLKAQEKKKIQQDLLAIQKADGGWALATLGDWQRGDGKEQDLETSDGYGTGFVVYVLRQSGIDTEHPSIQKGLDWLKANQRESGRWFTRSLYQDNYHYLTHAGSAFAVMALSVCEESVKTSTDQAP